MSEQKAAPLRSVCHCTFQREKDSPWESGIAVLNSPGAYDVAVIIPSDAASEADCLGSLKQSWQYHLQPDLGCFVFGGSTKPTSSTWIVPMIDNATQPVHDGEEQFTYLPEMSLEDFRKSARPFAPDADSLEKFRQESGYSGDFGALTMYAEGFIIEKREGTGYLPYAWWYAPIACTLKEEAEEILWKWRDEFTESLPELQDNVSVVELMDKDVVPTDGGSLPTEGG